MLRVLCTRNVEICCHFSHTAHSNQQTIVRQRRGALVKRHRRQLCNLLTLNKVRTKHQNTVPRLSLVKNYDKIYSDCVQFTCHKRWKSPMRFTHTRLMRSVYLVVAARARVYLHRPSGEKSFHISLKTKLIFVAWPLRPSHATPRHFCKRKRFNLCIRIKWKWILNASAACIFLSFVSRHLI